MREFKFRIWDKRINKMIGYEELIPNDVTFFGLDNVMKHYRQCINYDYFGPDPDKHYSNYFKENLVLMQYTGSKDSAGHDIYEGDVLQWHTPKDSVSIVEWVDKNEGWDYSGWKFTDSPLQGGTNRILGNVFENPELKKEL